MKGNVLRDLDAFHSQFSILNSQFARGRGR
jgi:hypothetical protein